MKRTWKLYSEVTSSNSLMWLLKKKHRTDFNLYNNLFKIEFKCILINWVAIKNQFNFHSINSVYFYLPNNMQGWFISFQVSNRTTKNDNGMVMTHSITLTIPFRCDYIHAIQTDHKFDFEHALLIKSTMNIVYLGETS